MASTTIQFGKANFNQNSSGDTIVWSIQRQVLSLPKAKVPAAIFAAPNIASVSSTITVPLRGGSTIPASGVYDNIKVVIFKGFNNKFINTDNTSTNWFPGKNFANDTTGQTGMNFMCKQTSSSMATAGFRYGLIDTLALTPLAYFSGSATLEAQKSAVVTFSNPTFTEAGKRLENWLPSLTDDDNYTNKLYVGLYHDSEDITWRDSNGVSCDLLWAWPSLTTDQYATLTLNYGAGIVRYYTDSGWVDCEVYYWDNGVWKQCETQYCNGLGWNTIG